MIMTANFDINALIHATELSFQILQPFYKIQPSSSWSDAAKQTFERIKVLMDAYIRAIERSLDCSDRGIDICRDVLAAHGYLEAGKSQEYTLPFLDEIQEKAEKAHADAKVMADEFCAVQTGLLDICDSIPEVPLEFASKQWMRTIAELASLIKDLCTKENGMKIGSVLTGLLASAHPLLLFIIPLITSLTVFALKTAAFYIEKKLRANLEVDSKETVSQNLSSLQEQVSKFVVWWSDMENKIVVIKEAYLNAGREEAMALLLQREWEKLQHLYTIYNDQIRKIRDSYPKCRSEAPVKPKKSASHRPFKRTPLRPADQSPLARGLLQAHRVALATAMTV